MNRKNLNLTCLEEGTCPICTNEIKVKKDGTLYRHNPNGYYTRKGRYTCEGSGMLSLEEENEQFENLLSAEK